MLSSSLPRLARLCLRRQRSASTSAAASGVFDAPLKAAQRRAAALGATRSGGGSGETASRSYDYLHDAVARRLVERLRDVRRTFPAALDLGAGSGAVLRALLAEAAEARAAAAEAAAATASTLAAAGAAAAAGEPPPPPPLCPGGIETLHMLEPVRERLYRDAASWPQAAPLLTLRPALSDEGDRLPYADASLDLVLSSCALHWQGDLSSVLAEVRRVLRPDGVFLAALLGGETLAELRSAFVAAQMEREGGVSPFTSPMAGVAEVGNALAAAGFGIPTIDGETLRVEYPSALRLCEHLQGMGEGGAAAQRRQGGRRDTMLAMAAVYQSMYAAPPEEGAAAEGAAAAAAAAGVTASFDVIYLIGWSPAASQPQPLRRGSVAKGLAARGSQPPPEAAAAQ